MELVSLGTGTLTPQNEVGSAAFAVVEGDRVLGLDFGRNALSRHAEAGLDPLHLGELLLTHVHPDHCCELVSLFFARNYARPASGGEVGRLRLGGPVGVGRLVADLETAWPWLRPPLEAPRRDVLEWDGEDGACVEGIEGFEVRAWTMEHGNTVDLGYRVRSPRSGKVVAYTGDTGPCDNLVELARDADLFVCECSWPGPRDPGVHLWPEAISDVVARARPRRVLLTHFYPETDPQKAASRVREAFEGSVELARDGARWRV